MIGEFAARREIDAGELVVVPVDHAPFQGTQGRVLVKAGRPLATAASELLKWILQMAMFSVAKSTGRASPSAEGQDCKPARR